MAFYNPFITRKERTVGTRYPYFYGVAPIVRPYQFINPIIGKLLSGDFMFPGSIARFFKGISEAPKDKPLYVKQGISKYPDFDPYNIQLYEVPKSEVPVVSDMGNRISIWLYDQWETKKNGGQPYISLDFIPTEVEFDVSSEMPSIGVVGLNYPHYHYAGSKEVVSFTIEWYDYGRDKDAVLLKCRKLDALSKGDGFNNSPPYIYIDWGTMGDSVKIETKGGMFAGQIYTVQAANYTVSQFTQNRYLSSENGRANISPNALRPVLAKQDIVLIRQAHNLTRNEIIYNRTKKQ